MKIPNWRISVWGRYGYLLLIGLPVLIMTIRGFEGRLDSNQGAWMGIICLISLCMTHAYVYSYKLIKEELDMISLFLSQVMLQSESRGSQGIDQKEKEVDSGQ